MRSSRGWWRPVLVVAALGLLAAGCIPEGTHEVSSFGAGGISPGLWRTLGGNDCSWVRRSSSGAVLSSIRSFGGPRCEQVDASDATFAHQGCVPFWSEPGPFAKPLVR